MTAPALPEGARQMHVYPSTPTYAADEPAENETPASPLRGVGFDTKQTAAKPEKQQRPVQPARRQPSTSSRPPGFFHALADSTSQKLYLLVILLQAIVVLVMISITFAKIQDNIRVETDQLRSIQVYL